MRLTVKLPRVADTATEVAVTRLLVGIGSAVAQGEPIVIVETDKAEVEVPSPVAGTVVEVLVGAGDEIEIGAPLLVLEGQ
jgi:pyruvate/2-oxoglutarate dehydrogenase complex dihydrolipoamide acyltransferase (E2) component